MLADDFQVDFEIERTFGQNEVLKGISLAAHKGDVISIIGSSGSGKRTFLRCINLLETPTAGEIWVNGELIQMKNNRAALEGVSGILLISLASKVAFSDR